MRQKDLSLGNRLIAALPAFQRGLLLEHSEFVELKLHAVVVHAQERIDHGYFPIEGFVSNVFQVDGAADTEVAMIGHEGMFSTDIVLGVAQASFSTVVQGAGRALKVHRNALRLRRADDSSLRDILMRYVAVGHRQAAQKIFCMNHHNVKQRLARSLLMARDRGHSNEMFVTHDALSIMLGVRRETVSIAASALQQSGLISYSRGYVMLLDESALEAASCPCYSAELDAYNKMFAPQDMPVPQLSPLFSCSANTAEP